MKCFKANPRTADILERLAHLSTRATISDICKLIGIAKLSLGVIYSGEYCNVDKKVGLNANSIYYVRSISKAIVTASFTLLIYKGKLSWFTPLKELILKYANPVTITRFTELKSEANIEDLLAMWTGLPTLLILKTETARIFGLLEPQYKFRLKIGSPARASSLEQSTKGLLYNHLGLNITTFNNPAKDNYITAYITLTDRSPLTVPYPPLRFNHLLAAVSPRAVINEHSHYYSSLVSVNSYKSPRGLPTIAKGIPEPVQLIYYNGAIASALSAIYLLLKTNTFALCDAPDWIAQFLMEILAKERTLSAKLRELSKYVKRYYNSISNFYLNVAVHGDNGLRITT
ncbi:hypothetical protein QBC46DRAFT_367853 [Diplogelasinospora grovesii]|uniref:Beta-lactamase-related domain-containing protein n=1 Tax=Diplogelasinospora grovesii TaxID=303347 RepID=A0AAN6MXQ7_9PEZI|nr:hypothetical protein QBC46DRAFT_367853 [Diplogelasinospora grovesii]